MEKLLYCLSAALILFVFFDLIFFHTSGPFRKNIRIVKIRRNNEEVTYRIQQRDWIGLWRNCTRMVGMDTYAYIEFEKFSEAKAYVKRYKESLEELKGYEIKSKEVMKDDNLESPRTQSNRID